MAIDLSQTFPDLRSMHDGVAKYMLTAPQGKLSSFSSTEAQLHDLQLKSASIRYDFGLEEAWTGKARWNTLVRQYIDQYAMEEWLTKIDTKLTGTKRGTAVMRTKDVAPRRGKTTTRAWGSCMLGIGYRRFPKPTLILHSRATYLGYIGQLDIGVINALAREVAQVQQGVEAEDIGFVWNLESAQLHNFRSMAWFFQNDRRGEWFESDKHAGKFPLLDLCRKTHRKYEDLNQEGVLYGDMSFVSQLRVRKRLNTEWHGIEFAKQFEGGSRLTSESNHKAFAPLPVCPVSTLDFSALKYAEAPQATADIIEELDDDDAELL